VDGGPGHPIFHAASGIRQFQLGHNPSRTGGHNFPKLHERRVADGSEHVCGKMNHGSLVNYAVLAGVKSNASTIRVNGSLAASLTSLTRFWFGASKRHMQCASPGTNVLRM